MTELQHNSTTLHDKVSSVGIIGAGKMGVGIATVTSHYGITTHLNDITLAQAEKGKHTIALALYNKYRQGQLNQTQMEQQLARIHPCDSPAALSDCDIIIDAIYENKELKTISTMEVAPYLKCDGIMGSNTCSLSITTLAQACRDPSRFIGMHFFSPVRKIQLIELILTAQTSDDCLTRARRFALQIDKFPIVVNDVRGFFISRVFRSFMHEGVAMLGDGVHPAIIEKAARHIGMPYGPLAVQDEASLTLSHLLTTQAQYDMETEGIAWQSHPAHAIIEQMVTNYRRCGRACGAGFYDYPASKKKQLWPKLYGLFSSEPQHLPQEDLHDRLLYCQSLESLRCLEQGVLHSVRDANLGSIMGIGFPAWTGGVVRYIHHVGAANFTARARQLQQRYGERFAPPDILLRHSAAQPLF